MVEGSRGLISRGFMDYWIRFFSILAASLWSTVLPANAQVNVTQEHNNLSRDGLFTDAAFTPSAAANQGYRAPVANGVPRPDHVVIVIEENHGYSEIIGSSAAPYINSLAAQGALFTHSSAITHPSQPNYLDLFSGYNQGVTDDSCPHSLSTANLAAQLAAAGLSFGGYSEDLPSKGSTVCTSGYYARKHNPWVNWQAVNDNTIGRNQLASTTNLPFSAFPREDAGFANLPTVAIVVIAQ